MNPDPLSTIQELAELIEAIDRRSPQLQRSGEAAVMEAATRLRIEARARITELEALTRDGLSHLPRP